MIFLISLFLIAMVTYFLQLFLPWYAIAFMPFLVGLFLSKKAPGAFFAGFFGIALLWGLLSYLIHYQSGGILTARIAELLQVGRSGFVIVITAVLGGLVGGFCCMAGYYLRRIFTTKQKKSNRYEFS